MKTLINNILNSELIYRSSSNDDALKSWPLKKTHCSIYLYNDVPCTDVDYIICSTLSINGGQLTYNELATILGFNVIDDFKVDPKRYADAAECEIFESLIKAVKDDDIIIIEGEFIRLSELGEFALKNNHKRLFFKGECDFIENLNIQVSEPYSFPFVEALAIKTKINANLVRVSYYEKLVSKYDIEPIILEDERILVKALLLQTLDHNIFSASLSANRFSIDGNKVNISIHRFNNVDYAIVYSNNGTVSEYATNILNDSLNVKIKDLKVEWGYYLRLLNNPNAKLDYENLFPFEDIIDWSRIINDTRFCWEDKLLFNLLANNIDANLWYEISLKCPIYSIKSYLSNNVERWDWNVLTNRIDGDFIVQNALSYPWDFGSITNNQSVSDCNLEELLLNSHITNINWDWIDIMPKLSNKFIIKHIDDVAFDLFDFTKKEEDEAKKLLLLFPDKLWNWDYVSKNYELDYILENISLLAKRIELGEVILRAFRSVDHSHKFCISRAFKKEIKEAIDLRNFQYSVNKLELQWNYEIIDFLEEVGLLKWNCLIINGFEFNNYIKWDLPFFERYSCKIAIQKGYDCVSNRITDVSIIDKHSSFPWNWDILSNRKDCINNLDFLQSNLSKINIKIAFSHFSSQIFSSFFSSEVIQSYLREHPDECSHATDFATIEIVRNNISFNWDWSKLTKKTITLLKIDKLGHDLWIDKWDWNYLSEYLESQQIYNYLTQYQKYWNWDTLSRRLSKSQIISVIADYVYYWDWKFLIEESFDKEDLTLEQNLPTIATCISVLDDELQIEIWNKITQKFSLSELYELIYITIALDSSTYFKWDIQYLYNQDEFDINDYLNLYSDNVDWNLLSKSRSAERLFSYDNTILSFSMWLKMVKSLLFDSKYHWNFAALSHNAAINWHPALLSINTDAWDWEYLSLNSKCFSNSFGKNNISNLKQFKNKVNFKLLSRRSDFTFDENVLKKFEKYPWDWSALSTSENLSVSYNFIIEFKNKDWDWKSFSIKSSFKIVKELLEQTIHKGWDWNALSCNKNLKISLSELFELGINDMDWNTIGKRDDIIFDNASFISSIQSSLIEWEWLDISKRNDLCFDESLLSNLYTFPMDWFSISQKKTFIPTANVLSKISKHKLDWDAISKNSNLKNEILWPYKDKLNWSIISGLELFINQGISFLSKYDKYLDWTIISKSPLFQPTIENLKLFKDYVNWECINSRKDLCLTNEFVSEFESYLNWDKVSASMSLTYSIAFVSKFRDRWNWKLLFENPKIVENLDDYYKAFNDKVKAVDFINRFTIDNPKIYHFAHLFNAISIIKSRTILSRHKGQGLFENSAGSNVHRRSTAHNYARFYYRPQTPTQYYNESLGEDSKASETQWVFRGYDRRGQKIWDSFEKSPTKKYYGAQSLGAPKCPMPVFFEFDLEEVLSNCLNKCYYSTGNMQKDNSMIVAVASDPRKLNTNHVFSTINDGVDIYKAYSQQEFLISEEFDFSEIKNFRIICYNHEQERLLKEQLGEDQICSHITTDHFTSSGINVFHKQNRIVSVEETNDTISFYTDYRDASAIEIDCKQLDSIEFTNNENIINISKDKLQAYPSISFKKTSYPITVRFVDLNKYDDGSWVIYSNEKISNNNSVKFRILSRELLKSFYDYISKLEISITKELFRHNTLYSFHGIAHTMRVILNAYLLFKIDNTISIDYLLPILYASLIHDLGKESDLEGEIHGEKSANLYREDINRIFYSSEIAQQILQAVQYHSVDDSRCPDNVTRNIIWQVLKDADALDRSRLPGKGCNPSFLRNKVFKVESGKELYKFSQQLPFLTESLTWDSPVEEMLSVVNTLQS